MRLALLLAAAASLPTLAAAQNPSPTNWSATEGSVVGRYGNGLQIERKGATFLLGTLPGQIVKSDAPGLGGATKLEVRFEGTQAAMVYALTGAPALHGPSGPAQSVTANVVFDPAGGVRFDAVTHYGGGHSVNHRTSVRLPAQR